MSWLRCPDPRPWATTRLVCFPHAGGSAVAYRAWGKAVSPALEVHAVQYPGRADRMRDPLMTDLKQAARLVAAALGPLTDRPLALFGHSMGALIAYETALILQAKGTPPVHFFASASRPVHRRRDAEDKVSERDDDGVVAELTELGGTDAAALADPELRELVLPYVRADFRAIERYQRDASAPKLATPITALTGEADPHVSVEEIHRWADVTSASSEVRAFPGGHFYLNDELPDVLAEIHKALGIPAA
ncbi:thioesterase II family protein [Actinocorallia sp. A-T 12471]|uniref:thioesterase II family protein n=1 Tax=Actinocorallia sp. A-T 12471 TaxID=3089813 RepID=UPI0029CC6E91|nr:alpha/beta fold hydrolase [Actinocorallia sp. A-T 12471]MDX6739340.1 alpha/beta fold hydrolase [Actinocorallia sp. A-T 12471]